MRTFLKIASLAALAAGSIATAADAAIIFVGSWRVDQGPSWLDAPPAYSGQQAAALLFGGVASDYAISTIDSNPANIDNLAWVSVWLAVSFPDCDGFPCGRKVSESAVTSTAGFFANPGDESAFVNDWAIGPDYTNYAFRNVVPEPASWAMLIAGFGLAGAVMRRRRSVALAARDPLSMR
jgi:hypothetical protein